MIARRCLRITGMTLCLLGVLSLASTLIDNSAPERLGGIIFGAFCLVTGGWLLCVQPRPAAPAAGLDIQAPWSAPVSTSDWPRSDIIVLGVVGVSGIASVVSRLSEEYMRVTSATWVVVGLGGFYVLLRMKFHWLKLLIMLLSLALAIASMLSAWMKCGPVDW